MYMVSLSGCEAAHVFYRLLISVLPLQIQLSKVGGLLTDLTLPYCCACQGMNYQRHMSMSLYIFNDLRCLILVKLLPITV